MSKEDLLLPEAICGFDRRAQKNGCQNKKADQAICPIGLDDHGNRGRGKKSGVGLTKPDFHQTFTSLQESLPL